MTYEIPNAEDFPPEVQAQAEALRQEIIDVALLQFDVLASAEGIDAPPGTLKREVLEVGIMLGVNAAGLVLHRRGLFIGQRPT